MQADSRLEAKQTNTSSQNFKLSMTLKSSSPTEGKVVKQVKDLSVRKDAHGNEITKGKKTHRISFCDTIQAKDKRKNIVNIIDVVSFKKYNVDVSRNSNAICVNCDCKII